MNEELNLERVLGVLRRRALWILLCVVVAAGAAYALSVRQTKKYTATASLVFNNGQLEQQVAGLPAGASVNQQSQQNTNVNLVKLGDVAARTARRVGHGLTKAAVRGDLEVSARGESNIVDLAVTSSSPVLAATIANIYAKEFVTEQQRRSQGYYRSALALVDKQLAALRPKQRLSGAGLALETRAQSLAILAELQSGNVRIAQLASPPTSPASPKVVRNTAIGGVLGLLLGLCVAFLLERFDRRIREPKDLEAIYRLPLLGAVPESKALGRSKRSKSSPTVNASTALPPREAEAFGMLRARLRYFNVDRDLRSLLVVSAAAGEGKTTIACQLAIAAAKVGSRVMLVDADLRHPTIAEHLNIPPGPGLSDVLIGSESLTSTTHMITLASFSPPERALGQLRPDGQAFDVLTGGISLAPNPAELIESNAMAALLEEAKYSHDLVVIDSSPLASVSDAIPLLRKVDGVIVVGRIGRSRRDIAQRLRVTLASAGAPLLGVIANGVKARGASYDSYYGSRREPDITSSEGASLRSDGGLARSGQAFPSNPDAPFA